MKGVNLHCDAELTKILYQLEAFHEDKGYLDCLREAIALYEYLLKNEFKGGTCKAVDKDGKEIQFSLI